MSILDSHVTLLLEINTDGCTYSAATTLMAFLDETVASLVAEELNNKCSTSYRSFETATIPVSQAKDESAVKKIVKDLIKRESL